MRSFPSALIVLGSRCEGLGRGTRGGSSAQREQVRKGDQASAAAEPGRERPGRSKPGGRGRSDEKPCDVGRTLKTKPGGLPDRKDVAVKERTASGRPRVLFPDLEETGGD